jgi:hypothetical protein
MSMDDGDEFMGDQSMEEDGIIPDPDPTAITTINDWLDDVSEEGSNIGVVRDHEFTAGELARYVGCDVPVASQMLQSYRYYNYWCDERCLYVLAHEGHYGPNSPWRLQSTRWPVPEAIRRQYRMNQMRHLSWDFYDHAKKEVKSFGAEIRQALVQVDGETTSRAAGRQRLAMRDHARDLLNNMRTSAVSRGQVVIDSLNVPRAQQAKYMEYFLNGFWPYVEVMLAEELELLEDMLA